MAGLGSRVSVADPSEPMTAAFIPDIVIAIAIAIAIAVVLALGAIKKGGAIAGFLFSVDGMPAGNSGTAFDFEFGSSRGSKEKSALMADNAPPGMSG